MPARPDKGITALFYAAHSSVPAFAWIGGVKDHLSPAVVDREFKLLYWSKHHCFEDVVPSVVVRRKRGRQVNARHALLRVYGDRVAAGAAVLIGGLEPVITG